MNIIPVNAPYDINNSDLTNLTNSLKNSGYVLNRIPYLHFINLEWQPQSIELAKRNVMETIDHWDGHRGLHFIITFTYLAKTHLVEMASFQYLIENNQTKTRSTECFNPLYQALTSKDIMDKLNARLKPEQKPEAHQPCTFIIHSSRPKIYKLIEKRQFKSFQNKLDQPAEKIQERFEVFEIEEAFLKAEAKMKDLLNGKDTKTPFKISFILPQEIKIRLRTTRVEKLLNLKVINLETNNPLLSNLIDLIHNLSYKMLYTDIHEKKITYP